MSIILMTKVGKQNTESKKNTFPDVSLPSLTLEGAKDIYHSQFWEPIRGDDDLTRASSGIANTALDTAILFGVPTASKMLLRSVGVKADGIIGDQTLQAVGRMKPDEVIRGIGEQRLERHDADHRIIM